MPVPGSCAPERAWASRRRDECLARETRGTFEVATFGSHDPGTFFACHSTTRFGAARLLLAAIGLAGRGRSVALERRFGEALIREGLL